MLPRYDEMAEILEELVAELPEEIFRGLNGGILFSEEIKIHPEARNNDLYIMGHYEQSPIGKTIVLYYGSIYRVHQFLSHEEMREALKEVLYHELTHHLETMAGEKDLVLEDIQEMRDYHRKD